MAWVLVVVAGLFETVFAVSLKLSDGFRNVGWSVAFVVAAVSASRCSTPALRTPAGGQRLRGVGRHRRRRDRGGGHARASGSRPTVGRLVSIVLVVAGVVGLQLTSR